MKTLIGLVSNLEKTVTQNLKFENILNQILVSSKDLPKHYKTVEDLQKGMIKDETLLMKIRQESSDLFANTFEELKSSADLAYKLKKKELEDITDEVSKATLLNAEEDKYIKTLKDIDRIHGKIFNTLTQDFAVAQKNNAENEKFLLVMQNAKKMIDDLASSIRQPSTVAEKMLSYFGDIPQKLFAAAQKGKSFGVVLVDVLKNGLEKIKIVSKALFSVNRIAYCRCSGFSRSIHCVI